MKKLYLNKSKGLPLFVVLITFAAAIFYMTAYLSSEIRGNINWHILPGAMFGIPQPLAEKGLTPLYFGPGETGWDGQFYYYIANDLRGTPETIRHIDADAYRYQRVGLSLAAKIVSIITLQKWVSPLTYYLTNLLLILLATYIWADYLQKKNYSPWIALFWSLGIGTQLTLLNGLPDAAADSFVIIALINYLQRRYLLYAITITFALLSREIYVFVPIMLGIVSAWNWFYEKPRHLVDLVKQGLIHGVPTLIWCLWRLYLVLHFHKTPISQTSNILNLPFISSIYYLFHNHSGTGNRIFLYIFLTFIGISLSIIIKTILCIRIRPLETRAAICLAFLPICILYLCFGNTVMFHFSGFMKTATIFCFFIPLSYVLAQRPMHKYMFFFLIAVTIFSVIVLYKYRTRTTPSSTMYQYSKYTKDLKVSNLAVLCLNKPRSKLTLVGIEDFYYNNFFRSLHTLPDAKIFTIRVENLSNQTFPLTTGQGAIRLSYQWLDAKGNKSKQRHNGLRAFIMQPLKPNQVVTMPMVIEFPEEAGSYDLVLSLVQEGCGWFYQAQDNGAIKIHYVLH